MVVSVVTEEATESRERGSLVARLKRGLGRVVATPVPIGLIVGFGALARGYRLADPRGALIFDEAYYVQAARVIAGLAVASDHLPVDARSGLDPNSEHPPLAKLILAGCIRAFRDRELSWRVPSVLLGTLCIWLVYRIALQLGGTRGQALLAAFIVAFENMCVVHSRIATLDIYMVAFVLAGTWLYFASLFEVAGITFAVAGLCKLNGLGGLAALALYEAGRLANAPPETRWKQARPLLLTSGVAAVFFVLALGALDCWVTTYRNPLAHVAHIIDYASHLTHQGQPQAPQSTPLQWWLDGGAFEYLKTTVGLSNGDVRTLVLFRGALSEHVIFAAPLALLYAAQLAWRGRSRLGTFAVASVLMSYVPFLLSWALTSRVSYIFYMLPSVPAIALAIALLGDAVPRVVRWGFVAAVVYAFYFSYPFHYAWRG